MKNFHWLSLFRVEVKNFIIYNFLFKKRIFQDFTEKWAVPNAEPMKALEKLADWMNGTGSFLSNMKMIEQYGNYWTQLQIRIKIKKNSAGSTWDFRF